MIYLDNAATSLIKPASVEHAMLNALRFAASPGRGGHLPAMKAADILYRCRETAAELFHIREPTNVVFTFNATHALNIAINTLVRPGTKVLISGFEHNSVTRPLRALNAEVIIGGRKLFSPLDMIEDFEKQIGDAELVICTHVSNVFGYILPVYDIAELCRKHGKPFVLDASQSAGVLDVDFERLGAAFVAMPGHKGLMGPQGTGLLLCSGDARPLIFGGSGSESISQDMPEVLPDMLEAGTHNVCGIAGLLAGMIYVLEKGTENILEHERRLLKLLVSELDVCGIRLFSGEERLQNGVLSFIADRFNCEEFAGLMDQRGVCARAGLHCAPLAHKSAQTIESGTVRLSLSPFTTENQLVKAAQIIKDIIKTK